VTVLAERPERVLDSLTGFLDTTDAHSTDLNPRKPQIKMGRRPLMLSTG